MTLVSILTLKLSSERVLQAQVQAVLAVVVAAVILILTQTLKRTKTLMQKARRKKETNVGRLK